MSTLRSRPFARTTPPLSSARNLAGHGEAVLCIERVVEGAAEGHESKGLSRAGGVGGAPPARLAISDSNPLSPTTQLSMHPIPHRALPDDPSAAGSRGHLQGFRTVGARGARRPQNAGDGVQPRADPHEVLQPRGRSDRRLCIAPGRRPDFPSRYRRGVPSASLLRRVAVAPLAVLAVAVPPRCGSSDDVRGSRRRSSPHARPRTWRRRAPEGDDARGRAGRGPEGARHLRPRGRAAASCSASGAARATSSPGSGTRSRRSPCPARRAAATARVIARRPTRRRAELDRRPGRRTQEHEGVEIRWRRRHAYALVADQVVAGSPAAVRRAIDAAEGDYLARRRASRRRWTASSGEDGIGRGYLAPAR